MTPDMIVRAWKDPEFRARIGAAAPAHPSGSVEIEEKDLVADNYITTPVCTQGNCTHVVAC